MARIELLDVAHSYLPKPRAESDYAVKRSDLTWEDGGAYALLGPSGCGKTTLLNIISGLLRPSQGRVLYDGNEVSDQSPEKRNIAQVFQFPVLYDTMSVFDNLAFPLRNRRVAKDVIDRRVRDVAEMLDLTAQLKRKAAGLTADAKQKISLGRALVRNDVAAILFDEPLTVIDPQLKWHLRRKLKEIHEQYRLTLIYVTHDQEEALTFADQVMVMVDGEIVQVGSPQELYENPNHRFVGHFIGSPGMNLLPCRMEGSRAQVDGAWIELSAEAAAQAHRSDGKLELGIRPSFLEIFDREGSGCIPVRVSRVEDRGSFKILTVVLGHATLKAKLPEAQAAPRDRAWVRFPPQKTKLFADGHRIN